VPTDVPASAIRSVVWATGYRPRLPWLDTRALDRRGRIDHDGGVGSMPGVFVLGLPFMRRRKSNFIDGVGPDAHELVGHVVAHVRGGTHRDDAPSRVERPSEQRRADSLDRLHERS
jgi:putative flavoprotein involved in K+ transport